MVLGAFRELSRELKYVKDDIKDNLFNEEKLEFLKEKGELIEEILEYIETYEWIDKAPTREKVKFYVDSGYDYALMSKVYDMTEEQARNCVTYCYKKLKNKIGSNTVKLIKQDCISEARASFYMHSGKITVEDFITKDGRDILPKPKYSAAFDLSECETELKILKAISVSRFESFKEMMDEDKMSMVLELLVGNSKKADSYRMYIISYMLGKITLQELLEEVDGIKENNFDI